MPNYIQDIVSEQGIRSFLTVEEAVSISVYPEVSSTNTVLADAIRNYKVQGVAIIIAETQTAGKGRRGKSFISPAGTGLYLSIAIPCTDTENLVARSTMATSLAVLHSIEQVVGHSCYVKWPNDIYLNNRKVCGMLCERVFGIGTRQAYIISGIGINVYKPTKGFPDELKQSAGWLLDTPNAYVRNRLAADIIDEMLILQSKDDLTIYRAYTEACKIEGRHISIILKDGSSVPATALEIASDGRLNVVLDSGKEVSLQSDQVSIQLD